MKYCGKCDRNLDESCFSVNKARKDGLQGQCKECRKKWFKNHYSKKKEYYVKKSKEQRLEFSSKFQEFKSTLSCHFCGESESCCLDFHHLDPKEKDINVSELVSHKNWDKLMTEVNKCVVLCANCHRKVHENILVFNEKTR